MPTRAMAARETAFLKSIVDEEIPDVSASTVDSRLRESPHGAKAKRSKGKGATSKNSRKLHSNSVKNRAEYREMTNGVEEMDTAPSKITKDIGISPSVSSKKRKRASPTRKDDSAIGSQPVKGGWDELPHGIGKLGAGLAANGKKINTGPEGLDVPPNKRVRKSVPIKTEEIEQDDVAAGAESGDGFRFEEKKPQKKRAPRGKAKALQTITPQSPGDVDPITEPKEKFNRERSEDVKIGQLVDNKSKKKQTLQATKLNTSDDVNQKVDGLLATASTPTKKAKKGKANPYGLTPGETPFSDFVMPTPEACKEVEDALAELHGKVEAPKEIPAPSLEVTGCGEVPSVLDALIRTRLSASTTSQNAKYAFQGLVERYGVREEGIGAGSVDWNKVRESDVLDIEKAIKRGGLAKTKSVSIKKILEMVHDLNIRRRHAFIKEKDSGDVPYVVGADRLSQGQKDMEIEIVNQGVLSLDFMHGLKPEEAMNEFVKFPGIGVKTASCVILFCLQRPSFAVDTHVWRLCKWLKWVPEGATRDQTFSHCEVRIPNEMKYSLHQLFIRHGKTCGRCRAITGESSGVWETTVCPIEHLVERTGKKKGVLPTKMSMAGEITATKGKGRGKGKKMKAYESEEDEAEMTDFSDLSDLEEPQFGHNEVESSDDDIVSSSDDE